MNKHPVVLLDLEYPSPGIIRTAAFVLDDDDYSKCTQQQVIERAHAFASRPYSRHCGIQETRILTDGIHSLAEWDGKVRHV